MYPGYLGFHDPRASRKPGLPAPRIGVAYSPDGKTSIRAGYGIFYAAIQGETLGLIGDNAPYGYTYSDPSPPLLTTPFVTPLPAMWRASGFLRNSRP